MKNRKHTLVLHECPDLESIFMAFIITTFAKARAALGVVERPKLKFVPAGPFRTIDWVEEKDLTALTAEALEERGYLFLDCGGGELDQHGKGHGQSSLDLLAAKVKLADWAPSLMPVANIISKNDTTGLDVCQDKNFRQSSTPHTPRNLRNVVLGLNLTCQKTQVSSCGTSLLSVKVSDHEKVVRLACLAYHGIAALAKEMARLELKTGYNKLFLADVILDGVEAATAPKDRPQVGKFFRATWNEISEAALGAVEAEWLQAQADYEPARVMPVRYCRERDGQRIERTIEVAVGDSDSNRFGAVTRLGGKGKPAADVTIQFYSGLGGTRFLISTKGIRLDEVAKVVRAADLKKRGVRLSAEDGERLGQPGHLSFRDKQGHEVQAIYFAEFQTCFGNRFRANSRACGSGLTKSEIVSLVIGVLGSK